MTDKNQNNDILVKILIGVVIAIISALILHYLNIDSRNSRNTGLDTNPPNRSDINEAEKIDNIDYTQFLGVYEGISTNTARYTEGGTRIDIKELDNSTMKAKVEVFWYDGLSGEGKLFGKIDKYKIALQGSVHSDISGDWDIEMEIILYPNLQKIIGSYKLFPLAGNPNGTQNGKFNLGKEL